MVVMHLGTSHTHALLSWWCCQTGRIWDPRSAWSPRASYVVSMRRRHCLSVGDFGHSPHSSAPQSRILVAVPPTVYCSLNQAPLSSQAGVQLGKRPAYGVALGLIMQTVAFILVLVAARAGVDTVLGLEVLGKFFDIDRLDIAANGVLHLDPITGVFKSNPLYAVLVLPHNKRGGCGNRSRSGIWVDICASSWSPRMHVWTTTRGALRRCLRWA